jgi:hypothetical protein
MGFLMALALQCLHANKQALVVSQQTKIGASEKSVLMVQGGLVISLTPIPKRIELFGWLQASI